MANICICGLFLGDVRGENIHDIPSRGWLSPFVWLNPPPPFNGTTGQHEMISQCRRA